jgi:hypothetical protein
MIESISGTSQAADAQQTSAATKYIRHTPFGDEMVDESIVPDFKAIFTPQIASTQTPAAETAAAAPATKAAETSAATTSGCPTLESVFGSQPFMEHPGGTGPGVQWNFNPMYFATQATADKVAAWVGGKVIEQDALVQPGIFRQNEKNLMVELPNGNVVNPGLIADFFTHGYTQSMVDSMIQNEVEGGINT